MERIPYYVSDYASRRYVEKDGRRYPIKPIVIYKDPMLRFAAELEDKVYQRRMSAVVARYQLIASYPKTNCLHFYHKSAINLIKDFPHAIRERLSMTSLKSRLEMEGKI
jgi:hypothetical protein